MIETDLHTKEFAPNGHVAPAQPPAVQRATMLALWWSAVGRARRRIEERWHALPSRRRTGVQFGALIVVTVIAYNYSLTTLIQNAGLETPLAYVSLVPFIALALAAVRQHPKKPEPPIHDRQVDYIVGVPLVAAALAANLLLPSKLSAEFWVLRLDLFTLPFFVAGTVAIIFGVRTMWRQKWAILYLFLAWPYPYSSVFLRVLNGFTAATLAGMRAIVHALPVAVPVSSQGNDLFSVTHDGHSFLLSVVSACSGVNSVVGFLLVGIAFAAIVRGPLLTKVAWMVGGIILLWAINLGRITFIFWAGKTWGEKIAINVLHPFVGLVTFSIGVLIMVLLIRPLGMHIGVDAATPADDEGAAVADANASRGPQTAFAVPKIFMAVAVVLVAAIVLGFSNVGLKSYDLVADASGEPTLEAFQSLPTGPAGWVPHLTATYDWAKPLFGDTSNWYRYTMYQLQNGSGNLHTHGSPVIADVINSPSLQSFSAYGVQACYQFHGYSLADIATVHLTGGVTGQAMAYTSQEFGSWSIVYWILPVKSATGTRYERTVLYVQNSPASLTAANIKLAGLQNLNGRLNRAIPQDAILLANRAFLVAFARETIAAEAKHSRALAAKAAHPNPPVPAKRI